MHFSLVALAVREFCRILLLLQRIPLGSPMCVQGPSRPVSAEEWLGLFELVVAPVVAGPELIALRRSDRGSGRKQFADRYELKTAVPEG